MSLADLIVISVATSVLWFLALSNAVMLLGNKWRFGGTQKQQSRALNGLIFITSLLTAISIAMTEIVLSEIFS